MLNLLSLFLLPITSAILLRPELFALKYGFDSAKYIPLLVLLLIMELDLIIMDFRYFIKRKICDIRRSYKKFMRHLFFYSMLPFVVMALIYVFWMFYRTGGIYFMWITVLSLWLPGSYAKMEDYSYWDFLR